MYPQVYLTTLRIRTSVCFFTWKSPKNNPTKKKEHAKHRYIMCFKFVWFLYVFLKPTLCIYLRSFNPLMYLYFYCFVVGISSIGVLSQPYRRLLSGSDQAGFPHFLALQNISVHLFLFVFVFVSCNAIFFHDVSIPFPVGDSYVTCCK